VNPDPIGFVGGCVAYLAGGEGTNVPKSPIGLLMPVSGFLEPDTFCIVLTLPNAVIEGRVRVRGVSLIVVQSAPAKLGSEVGFWGLAKAVVGCSP
jgi:hypothetical protein